MDKVLNLENFDAKKKHPPYLDSPRSIQACKIQGIDPEDLLFKPLSYFRKRLGASTHKEIVKLHFEHYERRRQNKLQIALQEYRNLCRSEFSRKSASLKSRSVEQDDKNHFLIEHEKKKIAMLEKKTQQEIAQMLEHEKQMEAIRKRNEEKEKLTREKEMWRLKQLEISAKEREEQRLAEERERKMREEEEQNELRRKQQIQYELEQRKIEEEKRKEKQRMKEARLREMERMKKQEELKVQTEKILNQQRMQVEIRKKEMEQREKERLRLLSERQQHKKAESEARRREKEEKLAFARQNLEKLLTKQKKFYEDKQRRNEMKRRMFEKMREESRQEMASKALEKQKNIEKVKEISQTIEEQRKQEYLESMRKADERKRFLEKLAKKELKAKKREEEQRELMRQSVKEKMEVIEYERVKQVFDKLKQTEDQVRKTKQKQQWEVLIKQEQLNLKRQDREDEVRRVQKIREYQRQQTLLKMKEDDDKTARVFQEKAQLMETRAKMKKQIERKKEIIMKKLEKFKKSQLSIHSEGDMKSILSVSERAKSESATPRLTSSYKKKAKKRKLKSSEGDVEELTRPSVNSHNSQNKEQILELMKHNHTTKLRKKLDEEQRKEDERNVILSSIKDHKERNRLEKIFGLERAKASQKLNDYVQKLENDMENAKKKYWLL